MSAKRCYKCGQIKPLDEFHKNRAQKDGHQSACKSCMCKMVRDRNASKKANPTPVAQP